MTTAEYYLNIDNHPFTGTIDTDFDVKISTAEWLKPYFNKTENYSHVENVTPGKTYHIHKVTGHGDVADFYLYNDIGTEISLGDFFFKPI